MAALWLRKTGRKLIAQNKKARHDYHILDTYECGLVLTGTEVKSLRQGRASLVDGFAQLDGGEAWLHNVHIPEYTPGHLDQPHRAPQAEAAAAPRGDRQAGRRRPRRPATRSCRWRCTSRTAGPRSRSRWRKGKKEYDKRQTLREKQDRRETDRAISAAQRRQRGAERRRERAGRRWHVGAVRRREYAGTACAGHVRWALPRPRERRI